MVEQKSKRKKAKFPHLKNGSFFLHIFSSFILGGLLPSLFLFALLGVLSVSVLKIAHNEQVLEGVNKATILTYELIESIEKIIKTIRTIIML